MLLFRFYDEKKKLDRAWYDSSMIAYSECEDRENDYKILKVVFKNSNTYQYKGVNVNDYVMFMHGGLDGSNGKALNKYIKPKCEFEKLADADMVALFNEMEALKNATVENTKEKADN